MYSRLDGPSPQQGRACAENDSRSPSSLRGCRSPVTAFSALALAACLSASAVLAQSAPLHYEFDKKVNAAQSISALDGAMFGDSTAGSNGRTEFTSVDISIPGNNALPVQLARRLVIDERYLAEELGGFGNWDMDVPYIEGTFSKNAGWTVGAPASSTRHNRCSQAREPYVEGGRFTANEVWHGYNVHIPGQGSETLLVNNGSYPNPTDGQTYPWVLKTMGKVSCLTQLQLGYPGEGFLLRQPDGTKYYFNYPVERDVRRLAKGPPVQGYQMQRKRIFLLATRIEDRFGNSVTLQYTDGKLTNVSSSDNRQIAITHTANSIVAVSGGKTWTYGLQNGQLTSVTLPDLTRWQYSPFGTPGAYSRPEDNQDLMSLDFFDPATMCQTEAPLRLEPRAFTVTHPSGAQAVFNFVGQRFYRSKVPYRCIIDFFDHNIRIAQTSTGAGGGISATNVNWRAAWSEISALASRQGGMITADQFQEIVQRHTYHVVEYPPIETDIQVGGVARIDVANHFDVYSLKTRIVNGQGLQTENTTYAYDAEPFAYCNMFDSITGTGYGEDCTPPPCVNCDENGRWTEITQPSGTVIRLQHGVVFGVNEGQLLREEVRSSTGALVQAVDHRHFDDASVANQAFAAEAGQRLTVDPMSSKIRPWLRTEIALDGETFIREVENCGAARCFDAFARATKIRSHNSAGHSRIEQTTYHDNPLYWVLGQVASSRVDNAVVAETTFYANGLPHTTKSHGLLTETLAWNTDGTLASSKDPRDNTTVLTQWYRGMPQLVRFADLTTMGANVDVNGLITSVTDALGSTINYGYDTSGRLASITYPSNDSTAWNPTSIEFKKLTASELGFPAGHWRQKISTGNAIKLTYFDARWRPRMVREYDTTNPTATDRYQAWRYGPDGRTRFSAYPTAVASSIDSLTKGVHTLYDDLGRPTTVTQDSELGPLETVSEYMSQLRTRVTSPKGAVTTTNHLAWGQPSLDMPIAIAHPEGVFTHIARNFLGNPTALTRSNGKGTVSLTRSYVYDAHQRLCKSVEPETGATLHAYDAASNLLWSKSGSSLVSTTTCDTGSVPETQRTLRVYDNRNRVTGLVFPDNLGNTQYHYEADGLLREIVTDNGGAGLVTSKYVYNRRRMLTGESTAVDGHLWSIGYGYNANGHLAAHVLPLGNIDYAPNAMGQPTRAGAYATGASYHPNGRLKQFTYGNNLVHTLTQNDRGLTDRSRDAFGAATVYDESLDYDGHGNVMAITDALAPGRGDRDMTYDALDRLTGTVSPMFGSAVYGYDVLDNLRTVQVTAGNKARNHTYLYDSSNRLTGVTNSVGGATAISLGYDAQGNVRSRNGQIYTFDTGNRLREVAGVEQYRYDGHGRRVRASHPTQGNIYSVYGLDGVLRYQRDERAAKSYAHVYLAGRQVARLEDVIGLGAPSLTAPPSSTSGAFTVTWTAVATATRYELQQNKDGGAWATIHDAAATSKAVTGLTAGSYGFRVRACHASGCGAYSAVGTTLVTQVPAAAPAVTAPATNSTGSFTVSWTSVATATRYELQQRKDGGAWSTIHDAAATSKAVSSLAPGTYGYQARACNLAGCGAYSAVASSIVSAAPVGTPVVTVPASNYTGSFSITWTSVSAATRYELQQRKDSGGWTTIQDSAATSRSTTGLTAGTYDYQARACVTTSCGAYSAVASTVVTLTPAIAPTVTAPATSATGSFTVSWTAVASATRYELEQRKDGGAWSNIHNAATTSKAVSGLTAGTYGFQARACNAAGCGPYSANNTTGVTLVPVPPPSLTSPASSSSGAFTVTWTGVAAATRYELQQRKDGGAWSTIHDASAVSKAVSGLTAGSYGYQVRACNASGCSAYVGVATTVVTLAPPPPVPVSLDVAEVMANWYYAGWTASSGATSYELRVAGGATFYTGAATSAEFGSFALVQYSVRACNASGCSAWSAPVSPIPHDPGPLSPEPEGPITHWQPNLPPADRPMEDKA